MQELNEIQEFLVFLLEGVIISFVFDFFRSIRNNFNSNDITTYIEDFIFLSLASILFIFSIIYFCNGIIRFYIVLGTIVGIGLYSLTLSKKCVIILTSIVKICKIFFTFLLKIVKKLGKFFKL